MIKPEYILFDMNTTQVVGVDWNSGGYPYLSDCLREAFVLQTKEKADEELPRQAAILKQLGYIVDLRVKELTIK